jgi:hypothetical protein
MDPQAQFEEENKMVGTDLKVTDLDAKIKELVAKKNEHSEAKKNTTKLWEEYVELKESCISYLEDLNRDDYSSPNGNIHIRDKWSVRIPDNDIDRAKFFEHLSNEGVFDKYITVNSATLNKYYREKQEEAEKNGTLMEFSVPGIGEATLHRFGINKSEKRRIN